jgi:hypothetical protein
MSDVTRVPKMSVATTPTAYFKMQIRCWTDFDPMGKKLTEIADAVERGDAFLTAVEVLEVKDDVSAISDNVVREGFENIVAARKVLRNIGELPTTIIEDLRAALNSRAETGKKPASTATGEPAAAQKAS